MASPVRTKLQRIADRAVLERKLLQGYNLREVTDMIGPGREVDRPYTLTRQQLHYDIKLLKAEWKERAAADHDAHLGKALAENEDIRREYAEAWERSKTNREKKKASSTTGGVGQNRQVAERTVEDRDGDPRFLEGRERCLKRECELLGLDAPKKLNVSSSGETKHVIDFGPEGSVEHAAGISALVAVLRGSRSNGHEGTAVGLVPSTGNGNGSGEQD